MSHTGNAAAHAKNAEGRKSGVLHQPRSVWAVFFAGIIAFMGIGLVDPILPAIAEKMHATPSEVSMLFTSYNAVMAVAMLFTGMIASRLGVKKTLLTGIIVIALFSFLGGLSNQIWVLGGLRGGWGLGNALFVATALTAIVSLSNSGVTKAIILYEAAIGLGISVGRCSEVSSEPSRGEARSLAWPCSWSSPSSRWSSGCRLHRKTRRVPKQSRPWQIRSLR